MTPAEPMRVIIDTDPGLDDAVAILSALNEPRFAVEAITAVAGNIGISTTTRNVGGLLAAMGQRGIPYAAGAAGPLAGDGRSEVAIHGADGLGGVALPPALAPPDELTANALLARALRDFPAGSLTILALGPLTNLATLARGSRSAYDRIDRIVAMGGTIEEPGNAGPFSEFNMAADPLAAREVLAASVPVTLIPLDVTRKLRASPGDLRRLAAFGTPPATLAASLIEAYFADHADRTSRPLHDPCVMLMALAPELFGTERVRITVDLKIHPGRLVPSPDGTEIEVAVTIDADAALDRLWMGLGRTG